MRIRPFLASVLAGLLLIFGVGVTATTSQAVEETSGSTVDFAGVGPDVPVTIDLYNTSTTGYFYQQSLYTVRHNVQYVCPKNDNWYLSWTRDGGEQQFAADGRCVHLTVDGYFAFFVFKA